MQLCRFLFSSSAPVPGLILGVLLCGMQPAHAAPRLLVDTRSQTLTVFDGLRIAAHFDHVALGVAGAGFKGQRGDGRTPLGRYRVGWFNRHSRFGLFIGLDYPNRDDAAAALADGRIDRATYRRIVEALDAGGIPPQNTRLGGQIGIHGTGGGDPDIQALINWTDGCVALDDAGIARLKRWVQIGTRVDIR